MREDLLHYLWKTQRFAKSGLRTAEDEALKILNAGQYNLGSGPDFFNARVRIADQEWAGNLEIHLKSSDWYAHGHETDPAYDNVILHVVWEDDVNVYRKDGSVIPVLELKDYVSGEFLDSYRHLVHNKNYRFINCEKAIGEVDSLLWKQWEARLFVERLEHKAKVVDEILRETHNDWELTLFIALMRTFGLNKNGNAFFSMAKHIGPLFKKVVHEELALESLLFGFAGFLDDESILDRYYQDLGKEFRYLGNKFGLATYNGEKPVFFGLRPPNFPTIRLSQLANVYAGSPQLFAKIIAANGARDALELLYVTASPYWDSHYTFGKPSTQRKKKVSRDFVHLVVINAIVPMRFCYNRYRGVDSMEGIMDLAHAIPAEKNHIVDRFGTLGASSTSAYESQAKIQMYNAYCQSNRCLDCHIGAHLLGRKG